MRKHMTVKEFNEVAKRCRETIQVNYFSPTIHASSGYITSFEICTYEKCHMFTTTNSPENFVLYNEVMSFLDSFSNKVKSQEEKEQKK